MKKHINKIYIFGDSILKGVMYSPERARYVTYKEERFSQLTENGIEVYNYSHMGSKAADGLEKMMNKLNETNCDENTLVIIEFGGNDSDHKWKEISSDPDAQHLARTSPEEFTDIYYRMIDYAKSLNANVACCNLVPLCPEKYMNWISKDLSRENILKWLGDVDILYRWQESYDRLAEMCAIKKGVDIIDIRTPFLRNHNYKNAICEDGIHPSAEGHRLIGEKICSFVDRYYQPCMNHFAFGIRDKDSLLLTGT